MARLRFGALSLGGLLFFLVGCRAPLNPWEGRPPPASILTHAAPLWQQLAIRRHKFQDLKGLARIRVSTAIRSVRLEEVVVVLQGVDAMRLEGIGPLGQPIFLFISDAQRFSLYTPQKARLISGPASARTLSRLFGMALAPVTLQYILRGDIPLVPLPRTGTFAYLARQNLYVWEGRGSEARQNYRVWFEPYHLQPVRFAAAAPSGDLVLQVYYEAFQQVDGFSLPSRIAIEQPLAERRVVWQYTDVQINTGVSPAVFRMRVPAGTTRRELE